MKVGKWGWTRVVIVKSVPPDDMIFICDIDEAVGEGHYVVGFMPIVMLNSQVCFALANAGGLFLQPAGPGAPPGAIVTGTGQVWVPRNDLRENEAVVLVPPCDPVTLETWQFGLRNEPKEET